MIARRFRLLQSAITIDAPINLRHNAALFSRTPGYRIPIGSTLIPTIRTGSPSSSFVFTSFVLLLFFSLPFLSPLDPSHVVAGCKSAGQVWKEKRTTRGGGQGREVCTGGWVKRRRRRRRGWAYVLKRERILLTVRERARGFVGMRGRTSK